MKERQALKLSTSALAAVIACLLIIISKIEEPKQQQHETVQINKIIFSSSLSLSPSRRYRSFIIFIFLLQS
jgi:hypothetical protein